MSLRTLPGVGRGAADAVVAVLVASFCEAEMCLGALLAVGEGDPDLGGGIGGILPSGRLSFVFADCDCSVRELVVDR